jgi:hypothetical protein
MKGNLAYCGLVCEGCPILWATREKDPDKQRKMRIEIVKMLKDEFGQEEKLEDITDCDGCKGRNRLFSGCKNCEVRNCAIDKGVETCGHCGDYPCSKLKKILGVDEKFRLDFIKNTL